MMMTLDELVDIFELLGDWDQRYDYLIELGEKLPPMPKTLLIDDNIVKGCMSRVWVSAYRDSQDSEKLYFHGECDTTIIKGVLAVLIQLSSGKSAEAIELLDVDELFSKLSLDEHLSPSRHVGVYAIVELMKQKARKLQTTERNVA